MASKFGGIPIKQDSGSRFGGVPVITPMPQQDTGPGWKTRVASAIARPVLETGFSIGGATLGTAGAPGVGTLVGGGLGYAIGNELADTLDEFLGLAERGTLPEELLESAGDVVTGAAYEAGGQLAAKGIGKAVQAVKGRLPNAAITRTGATKKAQEIVSANTTKGPLYAESIEEAKALEEAIPGLKFSRGQLSGDPAIIKYERARARTPGDAAARQLEQAERNTKAIETYVEAQKGAGAIDDVAAQLSAEGQAVRAAEAEATSKVSPVEAQTTGKELREAIAAEKAPVVEMEKALWEKIPNYEMPTVNTKQALKEAVAQPSTARPKAKEMLSLFDEMDGTVKSMQTLQRELSSTMANVNTTDTERRVLGIINEAIEQDFKAMGEAADSLDISVVGDKIIYPKNMEKQIAKIESRIAEEGTHAAAKADIDQIKNVLESEKIPAMQQYGESPEGFEQRLVKQYEQFTKQKAPTLPQVEKPHITQLKAQKKLLEESLEKAEPAVDVAESYRTARKFSKEQKFDRFDKGAVKEIAKRGYFFGGKKIPSGKVPAKFMDVDNADQLIRAIGKKKAGDLMLGHYADDMFNKTISTSTGDINPKTLSRWYKKHANVLEKYGIEKQFKSIESASIVRNEFENSVASKMLNSDVETAVKSVFSKGSKRKTAVELMRKLKGNKQGIAGLQNAVIDHITKNTDTATLRTFDKANKEFNKLYPAFEVIFKGSPKKVTALKKYRRALEIMQRGKASPLGGGSDSAENLLTALYKTSGLSNSKILSAVKAITKPLRDMSESSVNAILDRASYDPNFAYTIELMTKETPVNIIEQRLKGHLAAMGLRSTIRPHEKETK